MECLTPEQIQEILQVGRAFIYELFNSKSFPSFKTGGHWRVRKDDFERWIEDQKKIKNSR